MDKELKIGQYCVIESKMSVKCLVTFLTQYGSSLFYKAPTLRNLSKCVTSMYYVRSRQPGIG